jgi:hypothetical protein
MRVGSYCERYQWLGCSGASAGGAKTSFHHYQVNRDHIGHEMLVSVFAAILGYNASWFPSYSESARHDGP